jgi:hypothetical protein
MFTTKDTKEEFSRKGAKTPRKNGWSFRPEGEIFLISLALARDDGRRPSLCEFGVPSTNLDGPWREDEA